MMINHPKLMEMVQSACRDNAARQIEIYLRKEAMLSLVSGEKAILDVGCGRGVTSVYLAAMGHMVTGMDCSESEMDYGRKMAQRYSIKVNFKTGRIEEIEFPDESYDIIICEETLEHLENPLGALKKFRRILRQNGRILISVPNTGSIRARLLNCVGMKERLYCPDHKQNFTAPSIRELLNSAGFKNIFVTSDFLAVPKLPLGFFIEKRKYLAKLMPSLGHHIVAYGEKNG